jgi:hypothetical protein
MGVVGVIVDAESVDVGLDGKEGEEGEARAVVVSGDDNVRERERRGCVVVGESA